MRKTLGRKVFTYVTDFNFMQIGINTKMDAYASTQTDM